MKLVERDVTQPQRDLLGAGDAHALPLLQDLDEMAGFDQRGVGAGIEPRKAAAEHLDKQIAALEIGAVDVGDLQFAALRRLELGRDVDARRCRRNKARSRRRSISASSAFPRSKSRGRAVEFDDAVLLRAY